MNRVQFEEIIDTIKYRLRFYENKQCKYWENTLKLASGENMRIAFPEASISHLLGVNTNYLCSSGMFKSTNSYEILKELCDNGYRIYTAIHNGILDYNQIFSKHINKKLESFVTNLLVNVFDMEFICRYDSQKAYVTGEETYNFDYIFVKRNEFNEFYVMGLANNNGTFVPVTNQYYDSEESFYEGMKNVFQNQTVTIATALRNDRKFYLEPAKKHQKVDALKNYCQRFNCTIDVGEDYKWQLNKYQENFATGKSLSEDIASKLIECIELGKLITPEQLGINGDGMSYQLSNIINAVNGLLINRSSEENGIALSEYGTKIEELNQLKKRCEVLEKENAEYSERITILEAEKSDLFESNKEKEETLNKIKQLVN